MSDTQSASTFTDRVLQGLIQSDEPLENGYTSEELEEFQKARIRSPEEAADAITAMMIRAGSARLPSSRGREAPPKHTLISRRGHDLRMEQIRRSADAQEFLAELGPYGVCEEIAIHGMGGCIDKYKLAPMEFRAWIEANVPDETLEMAEALYADSLLHDAKKVFDRPALDKVDADYKNAKAKNFVELAGLFNRKRARAAPKIDIQAVQAAAVDITVIAAGGDTLAADKEKADRQKAVAAARVEYGTGSYIDPPGLKDWILGYVTIPDHEVAPYLALQHLPASVRGYVDSNAKVVNSSDDSNDDPPPLAGSFIEGEAIEDPTLLLDQPVQPDTVHINPEGGVNLPDHYYETD